MKKILAVFLLFSLNLSLVGCRRAAKPVDAWPQAPITLLIAGLDEAAENTDVLCLVSINTSAEYIAVMQIPRDTYFRADGSDKINALYASARYRGASEKEALSALGSAVSDAFGVTLDGAAAMKASALRAVVDSLGGVDVYFPSPVTIEGKEYAAGEHHLSGAEAEAFVRYRESYLMGDLGRVDAQKLFFHALLQRVRQSLRITDLIRMLFSMREDVITDLSLTRALGIGRLVHQSLSSLSAAFFTLPGEAVFENGHWSYIVNRPSAVTLLSEYFSPHTDFDREKRLLDTARLSHTNIYNDKNFSYRVYTEENLSSMKIQTKKE